ncbi:MAG: PIN domain protein [Planctomycetes bacterium]|uniref:PIN domain protein n=1 Tax=Candidatus Wunengus sp. YC65 TaxID=3367701 RepID=UPI001D62EC62|nr:PIN domain protein [Planctomycetota bacterium]
MRVYLDNCCFNRPFDDQSQLRIRLETEAKLKTQEEVRAGNLKLAWSYILDYENGKNPYEDRKFRIRGWKKYALTDIKEDAEVIKKANLLNQKGFRKLDSLHIACAIISKCNYFLSTDDKIISLSKTLEEKIKVTDPIGFIKEVLS